MRKTVSGPPVSSGCGPPESSAGRRSVPPSCEHGIWSPVRTPVIAGWSAWPRQRPTGSACKPFTNRPWRAGPNHVWST